MTLLTNSAEGGTNGTTVTTGNSGGTSGNAFDTVTINTNASLTFDNTHAAHGALGYKVATGVTSTTVYAQWDASLGTAGQVWFRQYGYFTANPAANYDIFETASAGGICATVQLNTAGTMTFRNDAGTTIFTTTAAIPLNQWFRIEGFVIGSATVGQVELKLYKTADSSTPDETDTSAASQNTRGSLTQARFGIATNRASAGPYWMDDLGVSTVGYIGPAATTRLLIASYI